MKKLSILIGLIVTLSFFQGCSLWEKSPEDELEKRRIDNELTEEPVILKGTILQKDISLTTEGTHLFKTEEKNIPVQSKVLNLNKYLDKEVEIIGLQYKSSSNTVTIDINDVKVEEEIKIKQYISNSFGISFEYPSNVEIDEENTTIELTKDEEEIMNLSIRETKAEGTETSIAEGIEATRINRDNGNVEIYIPRESNDYIRITYVAGTKEEQANKGIFYDLINSISYDLEKEIKEEFNGEECGGKENKVCEEGYYCEFTSVEENAVGACKKLTTKEEQEKLKKKLEDDEKKMEKMTKEDEETDEDADESAINDDHALVKEYISSNIQDHLYDDEEVTISEIAISQFEFSDPNIVSVTYSDEDAKRRITYTYEVEDDEITLTKTAYFYPGETQDWVLAEGENIAAGKSKTVVSEDDTVVSVEEGYRLYENTRFNFTTQYPQNWYFAGTGGSDDIKYIVEFADKPLDESETLVSITVHDLPLENANLTEVIEDNILYVSVERDGTSHYVVSGDLEYASTIRAMAQNLVTNK